MGRTLIIYTRQRCSDGTWEESDRYEQFNDGHQSLTEHLQFMLDHFVPENVHVYRIDIIEVSL